MLRGACSRPNLHITAQCSMGHNADVGGGSKEGRVLKIVDGASELAWLYGRSFSEWPWPTGVERPGFAARVRVFHAIWEHPSPPEDVRTYDEIDKSSIRRRFRLPKVFRWTSRSRQLGLLRELTDVGVVTGGRVGPSYQPRGWKRLRWAYLAARWGIEFDREAVPALAPFEESLPSRSWPASLSPPAEGSLDWDSFVRVIELCMKHTASALLYRLPPWPVWVDDPLPGPIEVGTPNEMLESYEPFGSGVNWWPDDHSWLVFTDTDLHTTNILGSEHLIKEIEGDTFLETHSLPPYEPDSQLDRNR